MKKTILMIFIFSYGLYAKVTPPNYNFTLDKFSIFRPGSPLIRVQDKYGNGTVMEEERPITIYKFIIKHQLYVFPIFVQVFEGKIIDFYATLPKYFLHDTFHQTLINRYGKQDKFYKKNSTALYIWKNKDSLDHYYSGACSITCFPIYYSQIMNPLPPNLGNFKSLIKKFSQ